MDLNKEQNKIIDKTIKQIEHSQTLTLQSVNEKEITTKAKNRCFATNNTFDFFEIESIELKENEAYITFKLSI
jgi:hypothetical protein